MTTDLDAFPAPSMTATTDLKPQPSKRPPRADEGYPVAIVYPSHGGRPGHVVGVIDDKLGIHLTCTCPAGRYGRACWAMKAAAGLMGEELRLWVQQPPSE